MAKDNRLEEQFEASRSHLQALALRMLGSTGEAEDAVQEAWLRLSRSDASGIENLGGWLSTVVARVCLDMLRSRQARREEAWDEELERIPSPDALGDPEHEALLADSVGLALLVVLDRLSPVERLAFVLHDLFAVPFAEIAGIVGRSPEATRQLASRARRRVRGTPGSQDSQQAEAPPGSGLGLQSRHEVARAFLAAARGGDFQALLSLLDPDVVLRADAHAVPPDGIEVRGASVVAARAALSSARSALAEVALINGAAGILVAPRGRLVLALRFTVGGAKIAVIEVIAEPKRLRQLELSVPNS